MRGMNDQVLIATDRWRLAHPGSRAAVVCYRNLAAGAESAAFEAMKRDLETVMRETWGPLTKQDLLADPTIAAYQQYDQRFGQNYHVAMQILSIAQKGKTIPSRNTLVEAMFMTELKTGVLSSAQDAEQIGLPITLDSAQGIERYTRYDGLAEQCKAGDQLMLDAGGNVLTSIAQGPTSFGLVSDETTSVAYCFYFPAGVPDRAIEESLAYLDACLCAACPAAEQTAQTRISADER
jgi:DNA/RNA-binding domain of Phe-tRNA-synthetase-like protein